MSGRSNICQLCGEPGERGIYDIRPVTIIYHYANGAPGHHGMLVCHVCRRGDLVGAYHYKDAPNPKSKISKRKCVRHNKQPSKITDIIKASPDGMEKFLTRAAKKIDDQEKFVALVKTDDNLVSLFYFDGKELSRKDGAGKCSRLTSFDTLSNSIKEILRSYPDGDFRVFKWTEGDRIFLDVIAQADIPGIMRLPKVIANRVIRNPACRDDKNTKLKNTKLTPKETDEKNREFLNAYVPKSFTTRNSEGKVLYYCCAKVTPSGSESLRQGLRSRGFSVKVCFEGTKSHRIYCVYSNADIAKKIRDFGYITAFSMLKKK